MKPSTTRVALSWFDRVAARRERATHAVWYRTASCQCLALARGQREAEEASRVFAAYQDAKEAQDREVLQGEFNRLTLMHEVVRPGWPHIQGNQVYTIPKGPVVRVVNRAPYDG